MAGAWDSGLFLLKPTEQSYHLIAIFKSLQGLAIESPDTLYVIVYQAFGFNLSDQRELLGLCIAQTEWAM
jgi:hypothetical protein